MGRTFKGNNVTVGTVEELIMTPKMAGNRNMRISDEDPAHVRGDLKLDAAIEGTFFVFIRVLRAVSESFSIGLRYEKPGFGEIVLLRVNGDHGRHKNRDGGVILEGPHLHSFREPLRSASARANAEAKWAWPLSPEHLSLPVAWRTFCTHTRLQSNAKIDSRIAQLHESMAQLSLGPYS